jgi:hypothetical protein
MERILLLGYYANHRALRKDVERLRKVVSKFDTYSKEDWRKIDSWFSMHSRLVLYHHHSEDEFFFPWIRKRSNRFNMELKMMDDDHKSLDFHMEKLKALLQSLSIGLVAKEELAQTILDYDRLMHAHLLSEEKLVERVISEEFKTEEVYAAEEEYRKKMTPEQMKLALPWMVEVMNDRERNYFFSTTPFFVKWIYRLSAKPKYDKLVSCI